MDSDSTQVEIAKSDGKQGRVRRGVCRQGTTLCPPLWEDRPDEIYVLYEKLHNYNYNLNLNLNLNYERRSPERVSPNRYTLYTHGDIEHIHSHGWYCMKQVCSYVCSPPLFFRCPPQQASMAIAVPHRYLPPIKSVWKRLKTFLKPFLLDVCPLSTTFFPFSCSLWSPAKQPAITFQTTHYMLQL